MDREASNQPGDPAGDKPAGRLGLMEVDRTDTDRPSSLTQSSGAYIHVHTHIHTHIHTYTYIHTYTHIHIYLHTHIHTFIHNTYHCNEILLLISHFESLKGKSAEYFLPIFLNIKSKCRFYCSCLLSFLSFTILFLQFCRHAAVFSAKCVFLRKS